MRRLTRPSIVAATILLSFAVLAIGGALLDGKSTAQTPAPPTGQPAAQAQPGQQAAPPTPVVEVPVLMQLFNKPLYTGLKQEMAQQPANEEQWKNLAARGLQAAEIANLVALRKGEGPDDPILRGATELQRAGIALADAAKALQWDATVQAYQGLVQSCNNCHQTLAPDEAPQLQP